MKHSKSPATRARGARAGKNAPRTPPERLGMPRALELRLQRAIPAEKRGR